ncbi:dehydrodolichyl diphosphate synthase complex subunit DHDDS-like [Teleopsis dalmanni]|uniref:dehydrodolichyl diphosphate synthase complex subunit DHDDS-like n=1 Tax=Teleopsis dalmanni TaxID=139649 RepID=UPI0018CD55B2|nr:dehydrodolichyl diphosphate synthase complex subunit DHDDS-like [Teleopsis dalmanni]XP_037955504.1 dehydrodolichyl diphosphate synthase complex subunit DHDDS-like [Teleopsis dalmanni]
MTWVSDYKYRWYETFCMNILRAGGHTPKHIAFVMDGNRRFAKVEHIEKVEGHSKGFDTLSNVLRWCLDLGINEVTTFAFSIENYKRSQEEVNGLFDLARDKFKRLIDEKDKLKEQGVCIRVIGNLSLLPTDLQELIHDAMIATEKNNKLFLNVAFSYTSRDEITQAVEKILLDGDELQAEDISECLLDKCLYTRDSPEPDLLFRTSGETRISDFLMWQLESTVLYFTKVLWPQLTIWLFLAGIFSYQKASISMQPYRRQLRLQRAEKAARSNFYTNRVQIFLNYIFGCRNKLR